MKNIFDVLESFCLVGIIALLCLFFVGAIVFAVNFACNNPITPFQIISFSLCFLCTVAIVTYIRKE